MRLLAIEKEIQGTDWNTVDKKLLKEEALKVYNLYLGGQLREHYFNEEGCAVLLLECRDKQEAIKLLEKLPLVRNNLIAFDVMELHPYTGYSRIIQDSQKES